MLGTVKYRQRLRCTSSRTAKSIGGTPPHATPLQSSCVLRGSTLVETLVMMLVAGIVFLSVMDGLTLFSRLQARRTAALLEAGHRTGGYYRLIELVTAADSIRALTAGELMLFREGRSAELRLSDSVITYRIGAFRDTLLKGVTALRLAEYKVQPDTVEIGICGAFTVRMAVKKPDRQYRMEVAKIEEGHGYEE